MSMPAPPATRRCHPEASGYAGSWYGFDSAHWNIYGPGGLGYLSIYNQLGGFDSPPPGSVIFTRSSIYTAENRCGDTQQGGA